ncbi:MAG: hypothetical protein R2742_13780 [Micropruina glycogenica]
MITAVSSVVLSSRPLPQLPDTAGSESSSALACWSVPVVGIVTTVTVAQPVPKVLGASPLGFSAFSPLPDDARAVTVTPAGGWKAKIESFGTAKSIAVACTPTASWPSLANTFAASGTKCSASIDTRTCPTRLSVARGVRISWYTARPAT